VAQTDQKRLYQNIFESAVDFAIIALDVDGLIVEWNTGAEHILGWSSAEICGQSADCFFTAEDRAAGRPAIEMQTALDEGSANDERWHLKQDGSRFWANGKLMPLLDEERRHLGFVKILRDRTEQHDAAAAHQADAEFLRGILSSSGDCIKVLDLDGNVVFMSEGGQRVMEVSDFNAIRGCPWPGFWSGVQRALAEAAVENAKMGHVGRFQGPAETMAGTPRWWDVQVTPIFGRDGKPEKLLSISRDITGAREAETILQANETRWRDLFARLAEGFILGELVRGPNGEVIDWRYLDVNPAWSEQVGIPMQTAIGHTIREVFPGIEDEWIAEMAAVVSDQEPAVFTRTVGTIGRWYEGRAFPLEGDRFAVLFLEVTERRAAEERLRASEEEFRTLAQAMPNQVWTATPEGMLNWFSDKVYSYTGATIEGLEGDHWAAVLHPEDAQNAAERWAASLASGTIYQTEFRIRDADGAYRWHLVRVVPLLSDTGQTMRWVGTNTDIHDQKAVAQSFADLNATLEQQVEARTAEIVEMGDALRQSQKMEAVGQLTGGLAHDFNNLLAGMLGNLELLQMRVARGRIDDLDRFINAAQGAGRRAASLTQRLLAFSRRQTLDPRPTDVNRLIAELQELLHRTVGATVDIEVVQAAGLWTTEIDAPQLENAIINLCVNGRDAMPEGGRLTIETANKWMDDRAGRERDLAPGQYISICVTDSGTGMAAEAIQRAFEPFYTTKPLGQGTGLGLSMIYGFARQSGGQVRIYSEVGQGTTVCIYLPRFHGDADVEPESLSPIAAESATGQTVLVVEDEATIRHVIDEVLDELGYEVIGAADGASGIKVLQSGAKIELLITDVGLPNGLNGKQVADEARRLRPGLKVLFITGFAENAAVGNGHLEPGMELLTKPFTLEALTTKVAEMLMRSD
jgi:PAS domain S-box-containing protein